MVDNKLLSGGVTIFDGFFTLKLSKDRMEAAVTPRDEIAGDEVNLDRLHVEAQGHGVVFGLLPKLVSREDGSFVIAQGMPPQNGADAKIRLHVRPAVQQEPKMKRSGNDRVDFRELQNIVNVTKDKLLVEKTPPTRGIPGKNVLGAEIPAKAGKDRKLKGGSGVYLSEDGLKIFSKLDGKFLLADGRPSVAGEHVVSGDVDMSVGNIVFGGASLIIHGTVLPGFSIKCRGDITIHNGINNATVMAGGNLRVSGSIVGEEAVVKARQVITVDFIENGAQVEAGETMTVTDFILQGHVKAGGDLIVRQGKGEVIGGDYVVGGSMHVKELGSEAGVATEVSVGTNPVLLQQKEKLAEELELWSGRLNEIIKNVSGLELLQKEEGGKLPPDKAAKLKKYTAVTPKLMDKVDRLAGMGKKLQEEIDKMITECVYVYAKVLPGVTVKISNGVRTVSVPEEQVVIHFDPDLRQIRLRKMSREELAAVEQ